MLMIVDKKEIERLRRRFLKLDRDGSGAPFFGLD
jgi:Ca2+-binding EF-hand superfamily protein